MKLLHVVANHPSGAGFGVHRFAGALANALTKAGHENRAVGFPEDASSAPAYPFFAYNEYLQAALDDLPLAGQLARIWDEAGPFDLIVAHGWAAGTAASVLQRVHRRPLAGFLHGTEVGRCGGRLTPEQHYIADIERWLAQRAEILFAPSRFVRNEIAKHYQIDERTIRVLPGGAVSRSSPMKIDAAEFRSTFAAPEEPLLLFAGRFHPIKGADLLMQALPLVLAKRPGTRLVLAGEGPQQVELQERIRSGRLDDHIRGFMKLGPIVIDALHRIADVAVVPSRYEAGGIAVLDAILHDLPVVATSVGAIPEIARESGRVRAVPPESPAALATAILQALDSPSQTSRTPDDSRLPEVCQPTAMAKAFEKALVVTAGI